MQQILPFRLQNSALLSPVWNKDSVQFVEVVMKERLDVKGRSKFYNSYGVISMEAESGHSRSRPCFTFMFTSHVPVHIHVHVRIRAFK